MADGDRPKFQVLINGFEPTTSAATDANGDPFSLVTNGCGVQDHRKSDSLPTPGDISDKIRLVVNGPMRVERSRSPGCFPSIVIGGDGDEDDDVVPDLPKIPSSELINNNN